MLTAEPESTRKRKAAPPAEEQKPAADAEPVAEEEEAQPFDLSSIDPKMLKMAEKMGIPLGQIINWASSVEQRLQAIQQEMPAVIQESMKAAIEEQRQKEVQIYQKAAAEGGQGQGGGSMLPMLMQLMGGGGGYDEEMQNLTKQIMHANLDRMKQDASFTDAIKTAIVSKIAGKAASGIADNVI